MKCTSKEASPGPSVKHQCRQGVGLICSILTWTNYNIWMTSLRSCGYCSCQLLSPPPLMHFSSGQHSQHNYAWWLVPTVALPSIPTSTSYHFCSPPTPTSKPSFVWGFGTLVQVVYPSSYCDYLWISNFMVLIENPISLEWILFLSHGWFLASILGSLCLPYFQI